MALGGAATLVAFVPFLERLARVLAWVPWLCLAYCDAVVRWLAGWRFASLEIDRADAGWFVFGWLTLLVAVWAWTRRRGIGQRLRASQSGSRSTALLLAGMLVVAILAWLAVLQLPDGRLHVAFLDVGQGDAVLVTTPHGQQVLIDGGPSPSALSTALGREMPFWDRSLDLVVMTHPDADHITALVAALDRYRVQGWLDNGQPSDDALYAECLARLEAAQVPRHAAHAGDRLELGEGIALEVLHPPEEPVTGTKADGNNNSLVLRLAWQDATFLLTGDLEAEVEHLLLASRQALPARVLKVAHHGSGGSSTAEFLAAVAPDYAVLSAGADNRFGHPDPVVLERLDGLGQVTTLRTDQQGTIEFITDGRRLWVRTER
jgi:competence protein ComEC